MQKLKGMMLCITKIHNIFTKLYLIEGELKKHSQTKSAISLKDKLWKMGGEEHKMGGRQSENSQTQESLLAPGVINLFEKYLLKSQSLGWVVLHAAARVVRGLQGFCERGAGEGGCHCHHDHLRQPHQNNRHHNLSSSTLQHCSYSE